VIWLSWRQIRTQTVVGVAVGVLVAIVAVITGRTLHDLVAQATNAYDALRPSDTTLFYGGVALLAVAPVLIGAFWGAPMVAREVEQGTHLLVWNQSITRTRWLLTRFGVTLAVSVVVIGILSAAVSWWSGPLDGIAGTRTGSLPSRLTPITFAMRGIAPVAYVVFALALGVAVGTVLRRTLPAMAITIAMMVGVQIAVPIWIRPHLIAPADILVEIRHDTFDGIQLRPGAGAPVLTAHTSDRSDWILSNTTVDANGQPAALPDWMDECLTATPPAKGVSGPVQAPPIDGCLDRLAEAGYQQRIIYQPADRFWQLQWREAALFVALGGVLIGFAMWWTRARLV
jgi:hypothetical protein